MYISVKKYTPSIVFQWRVSNYCPWKRSKDSLSQTTLFVFAVATLYAIVFVYVVPDIPEAQKHSSFTFCLIFLSSQNVSKIWMIIFWPRVHRLQRWSQSEKMPPGGRAEIENVKYAKSNIFNLTSATRWHFWTFTPLFLSMAHCPKSII